MAVEEAGEIAVVSIKDRTVIKGLISSDIGGMKIGFMPHNVQVAPDNKKRLGDGQCHGYEQRQNVFLKNSASSSR